MCANQMPMNVPFRLRSGKTCSPPIEAPPGVQPQDRDERHLQRHDEQTDHEHEQDVPRNCIHENAQERRDRDRDDSGDRGREAVQQRIREAIGVEGVAVVVECPLPARNGAREHRPPTGGVDVLLRDGNDVTSTPMVGMSQMRTTTMIAMRTNQPRA